MCKLEVFFVIQWKFCVFKKSVEQVGYKHETIISSRRVSIMSGSCTQLLQFVALQQVLRGEKKKELSAVLICVMNKNMPTW